MTALSTVHNMQVCNAGAARQKWRARDAMWPAYYAVLRLKPWLVDPPPAQQIRAQVSNSICCDSFSWPNYRQCALYRGYLCKWSPALGFKSTPDHLQDASRQAYLTAHMIRTTQGKPRCAGRPTTTCMPKMQTRVLCSPYRILPAIDLVAATDPSLTPKDNSSCTAYFVYVSTRNQSPVFLRNLRGLTIHVVFARLCPTRLCPGRQMLYQHYNTA